MLAAVLVSSTGNATAAEPQLVFLVRHAERVVPAPAGGTTATGRSMTAAPDDPPLSAAGHERAARLAAMLRSADIRNIFSTEYVRTRQTAAPIAEALRLEIVAISGRDPDALLAKVRQVRGNVLIVGHANTVPDLLKGLDIKDDISIADAEFDNLFVVVRPEAGEPTLIRLRY
jgi:broad specificity phosphatase PhoE